MAPLVSTLDLKKPSTAWFDADAAKRAVSFFSLLPHVKGRWAGQGFKLEPWQEEIVAALYGWKMEKGGPRLYRECYLEVPRKQGKSTMAAGIAGILLYADREPGAEVYSAAVDREQAGIVFGVLSAMVEASPELSKRSQVFRRSIVVPKTKASYKVLSADVPSKHGLNASGYVVDEVHAHPNRELIDVIATSTGSREQPLGFLITTAGVHDETSIGWEKHHYTEQVASGIVEDPSFLGVIYAAEAEDDWTSEETWAKANPGLDVTVSREYLRRECEKAKAIPAYENTFKRLHLNLWTQQATRWISLDTWDASAGMVGDMAGRECYIGLHLASTQGCVALVLLFPDGDGSYDVLPYFWIPEAAAKRGGLENASWEQWAKEGFVTITPGRVTDFDAIQTKLSELARTHQIEEIGFNPQNAVQFTNDLEDMGLELREAVPTFGTLNAATKELERAVVDRKLRHAGNPVLRYMADSASVEINAEGNIKLSQKLSMGNISGLQALVQAMNCAIRNVESEPSIVLI